MKGLFILLPVLFIFGCSAFLKGEEPNKNHYLHSHSLLNEKKYSDAAAGFRSFVEKYPEDELADDAQFFLAYTFAYHANEHRDYEKALAEFKKLLEKYPKSYWIKDAKNWMSKIEELLALKRETASLKEENEKLRNDIKRLMKTDIESEQKRKKIK